MWPLLQLPADLVTFSEEIFNGKFNFLYNVRLHLHFYIAWALTKSLHVTTKFIEISNG